MEFSREALAEIAVFAPLLAAVIVGLGRRLGRTFAHTATIGAVGISFLCAVQIFWGLSHGSAPLHHTLYTWAALSETTFNLGFFIDSLTAVMMLVVTGVSLLVHVYTIGYMHDDPGYQRFFSYISLFTFSMLMLVMADNCLQLFFGWEGVGLVSYLLIGFWYEKDSAIAANLKAFLVNRVGDLGFILGIALIWKVFGSLNYASILGNAAQHAEVMQTVAHWQFPVYEVIALLLFIGAMAKSAQIPLHVWLPDSMEGPTPISALIHAATMVTAGVYMVVRFGPLYEYAPHTKTFMLLIGVSTSFFMGLLGLVQHDIKRIVAYSTLSQLGYMVAALGVGAYSIAIFHLATHAFFKALLFLGAGSVIVALHHEQDIRRMGGLRQQLPITYATMWVGTLALVGFPGFSGFYSKDLILHTVEHLSVPGSSYAQILLTAGVFITALYSFRLLFTVFHGPMRMDAHTKAHIHEPSWVIVAPLILLAIPSVFAAFWLGPAILGENYRPAMETLNSHWLGLPFYLVLAGAGVAYYLVLVKPLLASIIKQLLSPIVWVLDHKYGFDAFNTHVLVPTVKQIGQVLFKAGDRLIIESLFIKNITRLTLAIGRGIRGLQSGYVYQYAFTMILGVLGLLFWLWLHIRG